MIQDLHRYLMEYGIRPSLQRLAIMEYLVTHPTHPTADEIRRYGAQSVDADAFQNDGVQYPEVAGCAPRDPCCSISTSGTAVSTGMFLRMRIFVAGAAARFTICRWRSIRKRWR